MRVSAMLVVDMAMLVMLRMLMSGHMVAGDSGMRRAAVVVMMFVVSPLLAVIALVTVPISIVITTQVAKRSQKLFAAQWAHTGALKVVLTRS